MRNNQTAVIPVVCVLALLMVRSASAADTWLDMQSPHFRTLSNAGEGSTRNVLWQFEQIRGAMAALWPWMKTDPSKPILVIGAKDEATMRLLAPEYWERRGSIHPVSVWVTAPDQHYMLIRTDLQGDDTITLNPYTSAYFSYAGLILNSSFDRELPLWFSLGLAGVLSNTIVRDNLILLGPPIPWHLEALRTQARLPLKQLIGVTRSSAEYKQANNRERFDAEAWAFVHFLMFGDQGKHQSAINRFSTLLSNGKDAEGAFTEAIGRVEDLESSFVAYINSSIYSYRRAAVDAAVARQKFQSRPLSPADATASRGAFHVAMKRPTEARASIDEARKIDANNAAAFVTEGLLLDRTDNAEQARAAFAKAAELGTTNAYAHYRAAVLKWPAGPQPDQDTLKQMETGLARAVALNASYADAYARLAEVRAALKQPASQVMPLMVRAVELDPSSPWHRLTAARVFWRYNNLADARKAAQAALALADTDQERGEAQHLLSTIPADTIAKPAAPAEPSTTSATAPASMTAPSRSAPDPNALIASCQKNDAAACAQLAPMAEQRCTEGEKRACLVAATLQFRGSGVPKDEAHALATFEQLCDGGLFESCTQEAVILASRPKPDIPKARQLLTKSCDGGVTHACELLKSLPK
jgi:tetratricopeptide (TPR) repeat protein